MTAQGESTTVERSIGLCLQLLNDWLNDRTGRAVALSPVQRLETPESLAVLASGALGDKKLAVALAYLVPPEGEGEWYDAKRALELRLSALVEGGGLIWVPQGIELPSREPQTSEIVIRADELLRRCAPGGHGELRFPIELILRRSDEEGSYVTARGGLAAHWAKFTNRVFGHFQLDASELRRLPAGEANLTNLIEFIVLQANALRTGERAVIPAEDAWVGQRLRGGEGVALIGEPPASELSSGAGLRRSLRRLVQAVRVPLMEQPADARLLLLVGPYTYRAEQPARTALLGFDPSLHRGIDMVCLAAEGEVEPMLDFTRNPILAASHDA